VLGLSYRRVQVALATAALLLAGAAPVHARGGQRQAVPRPPQQSQPHQAPPMQGHHAGQWLRRYMDLPPEQQRRALDSDPQFRRLPPEQQQRLRERFQHFNSLPPQQQQRVLNRMETWEHLTPQQKQEARQIYSQLRALPPERQQAMHNAINALRAMPPAARERSIESGRFSQYSPQERQMLRGITQLPLAPAEAPAQP